MCKEYGECEGMCPISYRMKLTNLPRSVHVHTCKLLPKRNVCTGTQLQITHIEQEQPRGMEKRLVDLKEQLKNYNHEDQLQETEINLLKHKAVHKSKQHKWEAICEKLVLLLQAATPSMSPPPWLPGRR
ncbi:hypothetical protein B0H14DRAFT_3466244 [Mycena olivaceomarginata]|nr:hypothetical protein B0H14DRAFT_3466244 [Mycena olivaceomarginata]